MSRYAITFFIFLTVFVAQATEKPFWEKSSTKVPELLKNRKIPVSVKSQKVSDNKHHLRLQGIGRLSAPFSYTKEWTSHFNHLIRVSSYAREVKWDPSGRRLYLHTEAFNYHARMRMKVEIKDIKFFREIHFEVVQGVFTGMKGILKVHKAGFAKSLVSIDAHYYYSEWTIPKLFLEFGLEVVLQKFAERLRALIEKDFNSGRPAKPGPVKPSVEK